MKERRGRRSQKQEISKTWDISTIRVRTASDFRKTGIDSTFLLASTVEETVEETVIFSLFCYHLFIFNFLQIINYKDSLQFS